MDHRKVLPSVLFALVTVLVAACGGGGGGGGGSETVPPGSPSVAAMVPNGPVLAIAVGADGTTYIGGLFSEISPATGTAAPIDLSTGKSASFPRVNGTVYAVASDNAGGWYLGGGFYVVGGIPRNNLAHVLADGTVDPSWDPNANDVVRALAVSGSTVYAGGSFTTIGSTPTPRNYIAALDVSGAVTPWNPNANDFVYALAVSGSTVYAGGWFTTIGNTPSARNGLAALDSTGEIATWTPAANGPTVALAVSGSTVYAGGYFSVLGTVEPQGYFGRWNQ